MRASPALSIFVAFCAMFAGGTAALAQDAIPGTPPELRDFRLDPQRPAPEPEPTPPPVIVTPPPGVSTVPDQTPARPRQQPQRQTDEPQADAPPVQTERDGPPVELNEPVDEVDVPETVAVEPLPTPLPPASSISYWQIAAALAFVVMLLLGRLWLKRRRGPSELFPQKDIKPAPVERVIPPKAVIAAPVVAKPLKKPSVTLDFIPEKATISFATLTVKGHLRLTNTGDAPATGMELRVGLVSASDQQGRAIDAFHSASSDTKPEALGTANPGETIAMSMDLSVALTEMQSFSIGEQKLLVPIMVANLAYRGSGGESDITRIACIIGREANPPTKKMGPLRLELGPRSFATLGRRPVNA